MIWGFLLPFPTHLIPLVVAAVRSCGNPKGGGPNGRGFQRVELVQDLQLSHVPGVQDAVAPGEQIEHPRP